MTLTYEQARRLLVAVGLLIIAVLAGVMYARRVETVEVVAVLLFLPIFGAVLLWDVVGGAIAGVLASGVYVALRWSAIRAVGLSQFSGLVTSRVLGFVIFGVVGGWANRQLRRSLLKLVLYDEIDDATGLYNARFIVSQIDLETARSKRYKSIFSVAVVDVPRGWIEGLPHRQRGGVLRALGGVMTDGIRTVDRAVHSAGPDNHRLAVVLPETGSAGAHQFTERLAHQLTDWLGAHNVTGPGELHWSAVTFPGDDGPLAELRAAFESLDHLEHPADALVGSLPSRHHG